MSLLAILGHVTGEVPKADDGISLESILLFAGGLMAAIGAVVAALLTARAADRRQSKALVAEREREDQRLVAERERIDQQLGQERRLAQRADASTTVERVSRSVDRYIAKLNDTTAKFIAGDEVTDEELADLQAQFREMSEESSLVAIRFDPDSGMVGVMTDLIRAFDGVLPRSRHPSEEEKEQLKDASKALTKANSHFLNKAREALRKY